MPASRPRAAFEPISPHFDLRDLIENNDNFEYAARISVDKIEEEGIDLFEKLVLLHVIQGGKPLVIDGFENRLDPWLFTTKWLNDNHGDKQENARDLTASQSLPLTIGHYLKNMSKLTDQFFDGRDNYKDKSRQRVYLKDIDCPKVWEEKLREHIPQSLFYWNDNTGEIGGPGAVEENVPGAGRRKGKGIAIAGDLMSSLPQEMRAENLMCYIGHEGTYTPAHKEMCASLGQNIMVNASETFDEGGQPEKPGSSIWFMTETKDRHVVSEYWLSVLGHDIEVEKHFAQTVAWQRAPFKVYVVEQRAGDFILVPPLAPHQVWNRGTRTMKVAWNRTTVETLEMAMNEALPNARMVCRDEQYKNKAIIYYTLLKYSQLLRQARMLSIRSQRENQAIAHSKKVRQVQKDFRRLFELFKQIMLSEMYAAGTKEQCEYLAYDSNVTCAYCRGNIFNRFLTCKSCKDFFKTGVDEPYDMCMDCFAMGRSCACQSKYRWVEQWRWKDLLARYEDWRRQILELDGGSTGKTPLPLEEERKLMTKKTLASVCQEQLRLRPWVDVYEKNKAADESGEEIVVDDDGNVVKSKKKPRKDTKACHSCCHRHPRWMMAECTMCERGWCYGVLWRAYDLHPQTVMEDIRWECPHCQRQCSVGACRKDIRQTPYEPKGTLLGHDTKKVADARSVECLVDFSKANLNYLGETVDGTVTNSGVRIQQRLWEADMARQTDLDHLDDRYADGDDGRVHYEDESMIDPALVGDVNGDWQADEPNFGEPTLPGARANGHGPENGSIYPEQGLNGNFVALDAVMYNAEADQLASAPPAKPVFSKKRRGSDADQIKLVNPKKRKGNAEERPQPKNEAGKQYMKAHENKRLEQARKDGRYIQVLGTIKGRKRVVQLAIDGQKLADIISKPSIGLQPKRGPAAPAAPATLIQSDIPPPPKPVDTSDLDPKVNNKVRVRVEEDTEFRGRRKNASMPKYEVLDLASDVSDEEDATGGQRDDRPRGVRRSEWREKRREQGDEDLPEALPENWKDAAVHPARQAKNKEAWDKRKSMPEGLRPALQKKAKPVRKSTGGIEDGTPRRGRGRPSKAEVEARLMAKEAARMMEEENRRAKLLALGVAEEAEEEELHGHVAEHHHNDPPDRQLPAPTKAFHPLNGDPTPTAQAQAHAPPKLKGPASKRKPPSAAPKITHPPKRTNPVEISDDAATSSESEDEAQIPSGLARRGPPGRRELPAA